MATIPTVSYITEDEVKAQTTITGLQTLFTGNKADLTMLIQTAEDQIDAYCGPQQHHQYDANIDRVFPRVQDYAITSAGGFTYEYPITPQVPYKVSRACLRQVEWLYTQWYAGRATDTLPTDYPIESQDIGGDGSYAEKRARGGLNFTEATVCDQAKALLAGFVSRMAQIGVTDPRVSAYPRRDGPLRPFVTL